MFERDGGRCVECEEAFDLQYDHILPVAHGGASKLASLQLLCADCNRQKSDNIQPFRQAEARPGGRGLSSPVSKEACERLGAQGWPTTTGGKTPAIGREPLTMLGASWRNRHGSVASRPERQTV